MQWVRSYFYCVYLLLSILSVPSEASEVDEVDLVGYHLPRELCREICLFVVGPEPSELSNVKALLKLRRLSSPWKDAVHAVLPQCATVTWRPLMIATPNSLNQRSMHQLDFKRWTKYDLKAFVFQPKEPLACSLRSLCLGHLGLHKDQPKALNLDVLSLTHLDLTLSTIYPETILYLAKIPSLTSLVLTRSHLKDKSLVPAIEQIHSLRSLDLSQNLLTSAVLDSLAKLPGLRSLNISYNRLANEAASYLVGMTQLTALDLSQNEFTRVGIQTIAASPSLKSLKIQDTSLDAETCQLLATNTSLTELSLAKCMLVSPMAVALFRNSRLLALDLWDNRIGQAEIDALASNVTLTRVNLASNVLGGAMLSPLGKNVTLQHLKISSNYVFGHGAHTLFQIPSLVSLDLTGNQIATLMEKCEIPTGCNLTDLNISTNFLTVLPAGLTNLRKLKRLNIDNNMLKKEEILKLKALPSLKSLSCSYNNLENEDVQELKKVFTQLK